MSLLITGNNFKANASRPSLLKNTSSGSLIPMNDMVNSNKKVQAFGMGLYSCPSNEMLMKKAPFGSSKREKSLSFCENIMKQKAWVPGPSNYTKHNNDWS